MYQRINELFLYLAGLDAGKIKQVGTICGQESTRRIGDYKVKYGYTDIDLLRLEEAQLYGLALAPALLFSEGRFPLPPASITLLNTKSAFSAQCG